ncbi:pentapeptide repeat-containing protein [Asanoa ferruginea]|uniref:pentapeptide repeat-containing protein n=1 Tax=Asanoa ferruginea TaxID=53367 RepID=UPI00147698AF|nr:pentapeptide repeat-containing protein [Asanoa ferruginea]
MDRLTRLSAFFASPRGHRVRLGLAVVAAVAAVILVQPRWWGRVALAVGGFLVAIWPVVLLLLVAALLAGLWWLGRPPPARRRQRPAGARLPLFVHVGLLLVLALVVAVLVGFLLWQAFGRPDVGNPVPTPLPTGTPVVGSGRWTTQNTLDALKIVLSIVGGLGAVVALTVAYRRQQHGEAAEYREDTRLFTERFAKAAELLGDTQAAVRLAGVYAMAALADDWADGRQSCIDVLCAYLRMPHTAPAPPGEPDAHPGPAPSRDPRDEREVRHTVLRLVRDHLRLPVDRDASWHGHSFDFTGALFDGGDLSGITLDGTTQLNFAGATFADGRMSFVAADFAGGAVFFEGARFAGGRVSFGAARFAGSDVDFTTARFSGGDVAFEHAEFVGGALSFERAEVSAGAISFEEAEFSGGDISFQQVEYSGGKVSFARAAFSGPTVDLSRARFSGCAVSFEEARLFEGEISLEQAEFSDGEVSFVGAMLVGGAVSFRRATFAGGEVYFEGARFTASAASFQQAAFSGGEVSFREAAFEGGAVSFLDAVFASGKVSFAGAEFSAGEVSFAGAEFAGGEVSFLDAEFSGGAVVLEGSVVTDDVADSGPLFDPNLADSPPPGLRLPAAARAAS